MNRDTIRILQSDFAILKEKRMSVLMVRVGIAVAVLSAVGCSRNRARLRQTPDYL